MKIYINIYIEMYQNVNKKMTSQKKNENMSILFKYMKSCRKIVGDVLVNKIVVLRIRS